MGLLDRFRTKQPANTEVAATVPMHMGAGQAAYPNTSYLNLASEGYAKNPIVHACIRELANGAAAATYYVQAPSSDGGTVRIDRGDLYNLITRPNRRQDWNAFIKLLVTYLQVAGNAYVLKERSRGNQVMAMYLLRPDRIRIIAGDYGADGFVYTVDGKDHYIDPADMCHMALPNPSGDVYGLSPLQVLARIVNLDLSLTDFAKNFFQNAGVPSGLLKLKRRITSSEEAAAVRNSWRSKFGGPNNQHNVAILDDDAEYQTLSSAPKDMDMTGIHNDTESKICAVFNVPAIIAGANVGLQRATYSNYKEAKLSFHTDTLEPLVDDILRFLNYNLASEYTTNETITVDWAAMRSGLDDKMGETQQVTAQYQAGIISLNEARTALGIDSIAGGDIRLVGTSTFELPVGESAPVAVGAPAVEEALAIGTYKTPTVVLEPLSKAPRVANRARSLSRDLIQDREEETDRMTPQIQKHFRGIRNRIDGILGRSMERGVSNEKDFPFETDDLVPTTEINILAEIVRGALVRVSQKTFGRMNASGVAGTLDWSEKLPLVRRVIDRAQQQATYIHHTTNETVKRAVRLALERGYSIEQLARGVPDEKFPGLRSLLTETEARSRMIARTEVMQAQNMTSVGFYKEQGFEFVMADDGGDDDDNYVPVGDPYGYTCSQRNGQVYTVNDAMNIDDHPNGTLNWIPMPRDYQPPTGTL